MKTWKKILLLIGILLLALGVTITKIAYGRGDSFSASLSFGAPGTFGYDQKDYIVCRSGEESFAARGIERLSIDWSSGSVRIEPYDGDEILLREKASGTLQENEKMRWRLRGGELSVLSCGKSVGALVLTPDKELTVLVPESFSPRELDLDSASADWDVRALSVKETLTVDTASGEVRIEDLRCDVLDVDTASGGIRLDKVSCDALDLDTASGSITADALACRDAETDTGSGDVSLAFSEAPKSVDADSMSGDVTLILPKGTGLKLDFDTASGKLHGDYESGPTLVSVDTASGDLTIKYR